MSKTNILKTFGKTWTCGHLLVFSNGPHSLPFRHSVQCQCAVSLYSVQCAVSVYSVQCTVYNVKSTVYSLQCTVYTVHCKVFTVHCTLYSEHPLL